MALPCKQLRFASVMIFTLSEGEINELHFGLKLTMNTLFLKDLAAKGNQGSRGRAEPASGSAGQRGRHPRRQDRFRSELPTRAAMPGAAQGTQQRTPCRPAGMEPPALHENPDTGKWVARLSTPVLRRHAAAGGDRPAQQVEPDHRRRANHGARGDHPGTDPVRSAETLPGDRRADDLDCARSRHGCRYRQPDPHRVLSHGSDLREGRKVARVRPLVASACHGVPSPG